MGSDIAAPAIVSARELGERQKLKSTYLFSCPICSKLFKSDEPGEPMCTGPSETRDDHEMIVMHLKSIDRVDANPVRAEKRAESGLLMPDFEPEVLKRDAIIVVSK